MLWVPVPAIATHLDARALSPNFDWHALMNEEAEHIQLGKPVKSGEIGSGVGLKTEV
jgi:hypothetical protein